MRLDDWRSATFDEMAPCYAAEHARWRGTLRWDTTRTWLAVEASRRSGALPGLVLRDDAGAIHGWSFHLLHRGELQLGGLVAPSAQATECIVDAVLQSPEARAASKWMAFGWFDAPDVASALGRHGVSIESYRYLVRELRGDKPSCGDKPSAFAEASADRRSFSGGWLGLSISSPRPWQTADDAALAALLSSAYQGAVAARPFATEGTMAEWIEYATMLLYGSTCGEFDREISRVAEHEGEVAGGALITRLMPTTAHLAQLAVRPKAQGHRLGEALLLSAIAAASRAGCDCMTLLVRDNNAACRLYARQGFTERARFLSAKSDGGDEPLSVATN